MSMTPIDLSTWPRAQHYQVFRASAQPQYSVSLLLDITRFLPAIKARRYSFTFSLVYAVSRCANELEAFRCRFDQGQPVLYDRINTAFTYLDRGSTLFKVVNVPMQNTLAGYVAAAAEAVQAQTAYFTGPMGNDVFQFSALPWVSFTHISHTDSGNRDNATPLFDWGRFFERDGRILLPFSVQVHHSFVDGLHVGQLIQSVQDYLDCPLA